MIIRSATIATPRRTLPTTRPDAPVRLAQRSQIDSFEPAGIVAKAPTALAQSAQNGISSAPSSGGGIGGFFKRLFGGIVSGLKQGLSSLLGKVTQQLGGWVDTAKNYATAAIDGLLTKAQGWVEKFIAALQGKLTP